MKYQNSFLVGEKEIPYYYFSYEKDFTEVLHSRKKKYYFEDGTYLPEFIKEETLKQYNFKHDYPIFGNAMIIIIQSFSDYEERDLDNYKYTPFIDVIRRLAIVENDSWSNVALTTLGEFSDEEDFVDVYVVPYAFYPAFLTQELGYLFNNSEYKISTIKEKKREKEREKERRLIEESFF